MDIAYSIAGFVVGTIVGLTGVGGGSLMTPFLVLYGVSPVVAVGTDLVYAAITKSGAVWLRHRARSIHWPIVGLLALGSLPASALAILVLRNLDAEGADFEPLIMGVLSVSLILSSLVLLFKRQLKTDRKVLHGRWATPLTVLAGIVLGFLVTLSSVGAGALGAALLILLYPRLSAASVVGTDLAHAVPLTALAGLGHVQLGTVDLALLVSLLCGSLPGIALGTRLGTQLPEHVVRPILATMLLAVGVGFAF